MFNLTLIAGIVLCSFPLFAVGQSLASGEKALPEPGAPVDIALDARVRSWQGPEMEYPEGVRLQETIDVLPEEGVFAVTASPGEASVNIGLEWDEPRNPRVVTFIHADAGIAPEQAGAQLEVWLDSGEVKDNKLVGGSSPSQGQWVSLTSDHGLSMKADGPKWTYQLPPVQGGVFKIRLMLPGRTAARLRGISAESGAKLRRAEYEVRFDPPRANPTNTVEGYNAQIEKVEPLSGTDGFKVVALASDAACESNDRAIFTVRAGERSFSFLLNDLDADGEIHVKPFGVRVVKGSGAVAVSTGEKTITQRVLESPEQTFDRVLAAIPPKHRNKFLSLSPPLNVRKFAVFPNSNIRARREGETSLEFGTGESPVYTAEEPQHVEDDYLPILNANWQEGDLSWEQGYVVTGLDDRFDDPDAATVMVTRITAKNEGTAPALAKFWVRLAGGDRDKVRSAIDGDTLLDGNSPRALVDVSEWEVETRDGGQFLFTVNVPAGEARRAEIKVPSPASQDMFDRLKQRSAKTTFESARTQTREYWLAKLAEGADFCVPDERVNRIWKSLLIHQYCWGERDSKSKDFLANVAAWVYGPVGNESSQMAKAADFYGHAKLARDYYEPMWKRQGTKNLHARVTNGKGALVGWWEGYVFNTGFILWNLGNHYRLTGDRAWFDKVVPNMIKACDWLVEQRETTVASRVDGKPDIASGFFPPCGVEDVQLWFYWTMTNGYFYLGMSSTAELLEEIGHPDAARITAAAKAYLADLHRGFSEAIVRCPVVKLRDGSYVPYIPKHLHRRGRPEGHYEAELGALHLLTCNVYAPRSPQMDWTLGFHEDEVYMTEAPDHKPIISYENIERDWFDLGGYGKTQPYLLHTAVGYLRRDQPKLFLRSFWNNLVAQNFRDINAFPEHICWHGAADCKTYEEAMCLQQFRSMLILDEDGLLRLAAATPREWLADGKTIQVRSAPTFFGNVSYEIRSEAASGRILAHVEFDARRAPQHFTIRLRHFDKDAGMKSVTVNGKQWTQFDPADETIELPAEKGTYDITASYD